MIRFSLALLVLSPMLLIAGHTAKEVQPPAKPEETETTNPQAQKPEKKLYKDTWHVLAVQKEIPLKRLLQGRCKLLSMRERVKVAMDIMGQIALNEKNNVKRKNLGAEGIVVCIGMNMKQKRMVAGKVKNFNDQPVTSSLKKKGSQKDSSNETKNRVSSSSDRC